MFVRTCAWDPRGNNFYQARLSMVSFPNRFGEINSSEKIALKTLVFKRGSGDPEIIFERVISIVTIPWTYFWLRLFLRHPNITDTRSIYHGRPRSRSISFWKKQTITQVERLWLEILVFSTYTLLFLLLSSFTSELHKFSFDSTCILLSRPIAEQT